MNNNNNKLLKGLLLGSAVVGASVYISRNKELKEKLSSKVKDGLNTLNKDTAGIQNQVKTLVDSTKTSLDKSYQDTKVSLNEGLDRTNKQFHILLSRVYEAFDAGKKAAGESLRISSAEPVKPTISVNKQLSLGAIEDTSVDNSSELHPITNNMAQSVGDASAHLDTLSSKELRNVVNTSSEKERFDG